MSGVPAKTAKVSCPPVQPPAHFPGKRSDGAPADDPNDPHKGKFGGRSEVNGRRIYITNVKEIKKNAYMAFTLVVEATGGAPPLTGTVRFQLHPSFDEDDYEEKVINGRARSRIRAAYGAFTVGVSIISEDVRLELDLSELNAFPKWFRER